MFFFAAAATESRRLTSSLALSARPNAPVRPVPAPRRTRPGIE